MTTPLYQQPIRIPDWKPVPLSKAVVLVGGINGEPQNFNPRHMGLKPHDRLHKGSRSLHNVKTNIKMTSGLTDGGKSGVNTHACRSKKEMRSLAIKVCKQRGWTPNDRNIAGILSGKTL